MNKKITLIVALLCLAASSIFAEGLDSLFGIKFGTSKADFTAQMAEKGWIINDEEENSSELCFFEKDGGTYGNVPVEIIGTVFSEDKFCGCFIIFSQSDKLETQFNDLVDIIKEEYLTDISIDISVESNLFFSCDNYEHMFISGLFKVTDDELSLDDSNIAFICFAEIETFMKYAEALNAEKTKNALDDM